MERRKSIQLLLMIILIASIAPFIVKAQEKLRLLIKGFKVEAGKDRWNEDTIFGAVPKFRDETLTGLLKLNYDNNYKA